MKLLLVDDEEYVIESIKRNLDLTETGVSEVYTAFSVQQAKNIMGMVDIDIVISDIVMPGGTGFDFVEWVRKEELKVQVIFLTSYAEFDYARRAIQLNSVDYLLKPIDFDKLKEAVTACGGIRCERKENTGSQAGKHQVEPEQKNSAARYLEKCAERRLLRGKILRNGSTASAAIRTGTLFPADLSDAGNKEQ